MVEIISWFLSNGIITNSDVPEEATEKKRKMYSRGHAQALKTTGKQGIFGMKDGIFSSSSLSPSSPIPTAHRKRSESLIQPFLNMSEKIYYVSLKFPLQPLLF